MKFADRAHYRRPTTVIPSTTNYSSWLLPLIDPLEVDFEI